MPEQVKYVNDARERQAQRAVGIATQSFRFGSEAYTPEWEAHVADLPVHVPPEGVVEAQNPDGTWNLGIGLYGIGLHGIS